MDKHAVVSKAEWVEARKVHLEKEKELTRLRDHLARERRALPWVRIDKPYSFDGPRGRSSLADLFDGRSQLVVQHVMFAPGEAEACVGCCFNLDHVEGALVHLAARDVTYVAISRAPVSAIEAFKDRMGFRFPWLSSFGSDFNYDFDVSFRKEDIAAGKAVYNFRRLDFEAEDLSGISTFYKDEAGAIFHTYSTFARGDELLSGTYMYLDMVPKGRDEEGLENPSDWWRHHDRYNDRRGAPPPIPVPVRTCCGQPDEGVT